MLMFILALLVLCGNVIAFRPQPCCLPNQHQYYVQRIAGNANATNWTNPAAVIPQEEEFWEYYDSDNNREAVVKTIHDQNGRLHTVRSVNFYNEFISYTVNMTTGICTKTRLRDGSGLISVCIPDNATLVESTDVGSPTNSMATHTWAWTDGIASVRGIFTAKDCMILMDGWYFNTGKIARVVTNIYTNYHPGIVDQSVFNLAGYNCPMS
ncbi:hypothetical protein ScPMuIL_004181 [Solemya velum]